MLGADNTTIYRETIKNQAAAFIREAILTGKFHPEERIIPSSIAQELHTSRGVIREALMQLESEGLVQNIPYRGSFVSKITDEDIEEISFLRLTLESYALKEYISKITDTDYSALLDICSKMRCSVEENRLYDLVKYDSEFHGYFIKKISRSVLFEAWDISTGKMSNLFFSMFSRGYPVSQVADSHVNLIETLKQSPEAFLEALNGHYQKLHLYSQGNTDS